MAPRMLPGASRLVLAAGPNVSPPLWSSAGNETKALRSRAGADKLPHGRR